MGDLDATEGIQFYKYFPLKNYWRYHKREQFQCESVNSQQNATRGPFVSLLLGVSLRACYSSVNCLTTVNTIAVGL